MRQSTFLNKDNNNQRLSSNSIPSNPEGKGGNTKNLKINEFLEENPPPSPFKSMMNQSAVAKGTSLN